MKAGTHRRGIPLKISRMILLAVICLPLSLLARDASEVSDYYSGGFRRERRSAPETTTQPNTTQRPQQPVIQVEESPVASGTSDATGSNLAPQTSPFPVARPTLQTTSTPAFTIEPADPDITFQGEPHYMRYGGTADVLARDRNAPVFQPFDRAFRQCAAPLGCTGAALYACRGSSCRNESGSCHNSGRAIDMNAIICNGERHGPFTNIFNQFVQCIGQVRIGAGQVPDRTWATMFRETRADDPNDCATINASNARTHPNVTICHWDHVHISMYCRNGRSY